MDIINRKSATTLLVCCLLGAGFFMDGGPTDENAVALSARASRAETAALTAAQVHALMPESPPAPAATLPHELGNPPYAVEPALSAPPAVATPAITEGYRGTSDPPPPDVEGQARAALGEDLQAILP